MLSWPRAVRVFVHVRPTDLRRSFDRLACMAREVLHQDPLSGHLFVFVNRGGDRMKVLFWDRSGYVLFYKRLEIDAPRLTLILEGLDLSGARQNKRFSAPVAAR
jgi:transposase